MATASKHRSLQRGSTGRAKSAGGSSTGGRDWETIQDHDGDLQTAYLDTRYNLHAHGGVCIFLKATRRRTGKQAVLEGLGEEYKHTPDEYRMRMHLTFESGDKKYSWLNSIVAIASSARNRTRVIYDAYHVF